MFFMEWFRVGSIAIGLGLLAACICGFTYARKLRNKPIRIAIRIVSVPLGAIASLAVLLLIAGSGCVSHSTPIYSPSGELAARIEDADEGATGGETAVELFWAHGFRKQTVYEGEWKPVQQSDIQWNSDTDLVIHYSAAYKPDYHCYSADVAKVSCSPR
jgi:hypothetical protein